MSSLSKWTIMAYLDGNSELAPEMAAAKADMEAVTYGENIQVLLEIGLLDEKALEILRPGKSQITSGEKWSGVRRYHFSRTGCHFAEDLGRANMADPACLYEFILWGMESCQAEHYALILGGHSCEYIGMMNDYSQNKPYIMGIPEISLVFNFIYKNTGRQIDLLIFDTCLFNNIELLYELGCDGPPAVKTVLTYRKNAPAEGLPYRKLLSAAAENCCEHQLDRFIEQLVQSASADLIAYRIDHLTLERIKSAYSTLARRFLDDRAGAGPNERTDLAFLLEDTGKNPRQAALKELAEYESSLIVPTKSRDNANRAKLLALDKYIPFLDTAAMYYRLAFARNNDWSDLICSRLPERVFRFVISIGFTPMRLPEEKIKALIASSSPALSSASAEDIYKKLAALKNWSPG